MSKQSKSTRAAVDMLKKHASASPRNGRFRKTRTKVYEILKAATADENKDITEPLKEAMMQARRAIANIEPDEDQYAAEQKTWKKAVDAVVPKASVEPQAPSLSAASTPAPYNQQAGYQPLGDEGPGAGPAPPTPQKSGAKPSAAPSGNPHAAVKTISPVHSVAQKRGGAAKADSGPERGSV